MPSLEQRIAMADEFIAAGWRLLPLKRFGERDAEGKDVTKVPAERGWRRRSYSREEIHEAIRGDRGIGAAPNDRQVVLDYDPRNDVEQKSGLPDGTGRRMLDALLARAPEAPLTKTGSGGDHYFFLLPAPTRLRSKIEGAPGVDVKYAGGYVVIAGSRHPNGNFYEWDDLSIPLAAAPTLPQDSELLVAIRRADEDLATSCAPGELSPEQLEKVLAQIDPTKFRDYDEWIEIGMACHHATNGQGLEEFVDWSVSDDDYAGHEESIRDHWRSFRVRPGERAVTARTLFKLLGDAGGSFSGVYTHLFDDVPEPAPGEPDPFAPPSPEPPTPIGVAGWGNEPIVDGPNRPLYEMNRRYCVLKEGDTTVIYERMDADDPRPYERHFKDGLATLLKNKFIEREGQAPAPLFDAWLRWPRRRSAKGIVFDPSKKTGPQYLNTWDGWGVRPDSTKPWPLLRELIEDVLAPGHADYVYGWCAHMIQRPEQPAEVALVFRGGRGVGKGTFAQGVLGEIAGRHGMQISSGLTKTFNAHLRDCVYLFADEAFWAGDKASEGVLKAMVTEPKLLIEPKNINAYQAPNRLHIAIASNSDWVVPAGADERRFAIFEVSGKRRGDFAFWKALRAEMAAGGVAGFMADMLARTISGWHPRESVPQTDALLAQKLETLEPAHEWWFEALKNGALSGVVESSWPTEIPAAEALRSCQDHARRRGLRAPNDAKLGQAMERMCKSRRVRQVRATPGDDSTRRRVWVLPPLRQCRKQFEEFIGGAVSWPTDD